MSVGDVDPACTGKTRYRNQGGAREAIEKRRHRLKGRPCSGKLHPYRCRACGWWHLGGGQ